MPVDAKEAIGCTCPKPDRVNPGLAKRSHSGFAVSRRGPPQPNSTAPLGALHQPSEALMASTRR